MVRSLGLVALVVAASLIFVPGLFHPSKSQRFPGANYRDYVAGFRQLTGQSAYTPTTLFHGWSANAASLTGSKTTAHLHIGWVTPNSKYAGLEESVSSPAGFVRSVLGVSITAVTGNVTLGANNWQTLRSARGEYSVVRVSNGVTLVVTGSASIEEIDMLAGSLQLNSRR
jgi:hypothetical protein